MNEMTRAILRRELEAMEREKRGMEILAGEHDEQSRLYKRDSVRLFEEIEEIKAALGENPVDDAAGTGAVHVAIASGETAHIHNA